MASTKTEFLRRKSQGEMFFYRHLKKGRNFQQVNIHVGKNEQKSLRCSPYRDLKPQIYVCHSREENNILCRYT